MLGFVLLGAFLAAVSILFSADRAEIAIFVFAYAVAASLSWAAFRRGSREHQRALWQAERRLLAVFEQANEGIFLVDPDRTLASVNARLRGLLGYARGDLVGRPANELISPADLERDPLHWQELVDRGTIIGRRPLLRKDGSTVATEITLLRIPGGRYLGTVRDLSEQLATEVRRQQTRRIARLGSWEWEPESGKVIWDEQTFLLLGYNPARDEASQERLLERIHPEDLPALEQAIRQLLNDESALDLEVRAVHENGNVRWLHVVAEVLRNLVGKPERVIGVLQDLTQRRESEAALAGTRLQLAEAQNMEAIARLAAGVSHDINNIAGVILGNAELAELTIEPDHPARESLSEIRIAAMRAGNLTRQLQAFSRRQAPQVGVLDVASSIGEARRLIEAVLGSRVRLELDLAEDTGEILADSVQLTQVLINLAANARDALSDRGRLAIRSRAVVLDAAFARSRAPLSAGAAVRLEVEDDGCGMNAEALAHCFEPFFTTKGPALGTGLGLSTARAIVESMGGQIDAASEPGRGTCFSIWLPRAASGATAATASEPAGAPPRVRGSGEVVLVVDDVDAMREVVCNMLNGLGYRSISLANAEAALELLESRGEEIRLLLTDIVMGSMDGRELARQALDKRPDLPVLFMTGYADLPTGGRPLDIDPERLLEKPFTTGDLGRRIAAALSASAVGPALEAASSEAAGPPQS